MTLKDIWEHMMPGKSADQSPPARAGQKPPMTGGGHALAVLGVLFLLLGLFSMWIVGAEMSEPANLHPNTDVENLTAMVGWGCLSVVGSLLVLAGVLCREVRKD